jgi:hypothetical protein
MHGPISRRASCGCTRAEVISLYLPLLAPRLCWPDLSTIESVSRGSFAPGRSTFRKFQIACRFQLTLSFANDSLTSRRGGDDGFAPAHPSRRGWRTVSADPCRARGAGEVTFRLHDAEPCAYPRRTIPLSPGYDAMHRLQVLRRGVQRILLRSSGAALARLKAASIQILCGTTSPWAAIIALSPPA